MSEPIPFTVTRYRCPFCARTRSAKARIREHIPICWYNPDAQGCKTCKHFEPPGYWPEDEFREPNECDHCNVGVSLDGHGDEFDLDFVRPGPIIGCPKWEAAHSTESGICQ